jgi:hypothetical protein
MTRQVQGVIHGKTIELDGDLGIADGQRVFVQVRVAATPRALWEGILRSAGIAAAAPGFDEAFDQIQRDRQLATLRDVDE